MNVRKFRSSGNLGVENATKKMLDLRARRESNPVVLEPPAFNVDDRVRLRFHKGQPTGVITARVKMVYYVREDGTGTVHELGAGALERIS